jgi:beta-glucosidase
MSEEKKSGKFPEGFLWGAATSAHQVEGNMRNNWIEWEKKNAERLAKKAERKWTRWQQEKFPGMFDRKNYISGRACDHYHRFEEDFNLAKLGAHNAHRFSIEWSRVEPEESEFDEKEIEHYRKVIQSLCNSGMEPFVTLWHWSEPVWFEKKGGWQSKKAADYFCEYVEKMVNSLGDQVRFWIVVNEPNVGLGFGYLLGSQPPGKRNPLAFLKAYFNLLSSYKRSYKLIHNLNKNAKVGFANSFTCYEADICKFLDKLIVCIAKYFSRYFFSHTKGFNDFIGCNYYSRNLISLKKKKLLLTEKTDLNWEIYPRGIYKVLKEIQEYNLPIYITENGLADSNDSKREKFIKNHLSWIQKAAEEGADVKGYFHWSLLDNFEFPETRGFWPRFGLVEINYETLERKPRQSFYAYKKIIENNGLSRLLL